MSIITISRESHYLGGKIAEKVAQKLDFACFSRDTLLEALGEFQIPEIKLIRNIHDAISVLDRFPYGKERYIESMRLAALRRFQKDNVVYHGLAGHFFVQDISHVLKVRIIQDLEMRVEEEIKRENISAQEARYVLKKDDDERRKWSLYLYGIDIQNPSLYDVVLNIGDITVDHAIDTIISAAKLSCFKTAPESQKRIDDLTLAAQARVVLFEFPSASISAKDGKIFVGLKAPLAQQKTIVPNIENALKDIAEVRDIKIHFEPYL